jgi:hypothetical protein
VDIIHKQVKHNKTEVESGGALHSMLANAELQTKNQASQAVSRSQSVSFDVYLIRLRVKNL